MCHTASTMTVDDISASFATAEQIEGGIEGPAIILEDVLNQGVGVMAAIKALRNEGVPIMGVICVVDREFENNLLNQNGVKYRSLFRHSDLHSRRKPVCFY
jgi:orotate phosphoribosyltransferase